MNLHRSDSHRHHSSRQFAKSLRALRTVGVGCALALVRLDAVTLADFLGDPALTPKKFAAAFETFEYEYHPEVKRPDLFLAERRGDCDDYAILADYVLRPRNFTTRVIHVRLVGRIAHAVCYVPEASAYLDYNNRKYILTLQRSGRTLRDIANKVADSFEANWTSVSEFTYDYDARKKTFGLTVVKTEPRAKDADVQAR